MIYFKELKLINFLSVGKKPVIIQLDSHKTTLVTGSNGTGKSAVLLDGLSFCLFGKAYRNITKPLLVNSVNQRGLLTTLSFSIGENDYFIERGLKPAIFNIKKNGLILNQTAAIKDYQAILEKDILKINAKIFNQLVVLGSSTYKPFMQLTPAQRKEIIEDLLDISVFSSMKDLLKEARDTTNNKIKELEHKYQLMTVEIRAAKHLIETIERKNKTFIDEQKLIIEENLIKIDELTAKINLLKLDYENLLKDDIGLNILQNERDKFLGFKNAFNDKIRHNIKRLSFYKKNTHCPECNQDINADLKNSEIQQLTNKNQELNVVLSQATEKFNDLENRIKEYQQNERVSYNFQMNIKQNQEKVLKLLKENRMIEDNILNFNLDDINAAILEKTTLESDIAVIESDKKRNEEEYSMMGLANLLLKDSGIKTLIVSKYLPIINQHINNYLNIQDFFATFELNAEFKEIITLNNTDMFKYESFSEGEKKKIDLAQLFAWRMVAQLKNSISTNLLIMDEIMDSSLDGNSLESLFEMISSQNENICTFIISHRPDFGDRLERHIEFKKRGDFTVL